MYVSLRTFPQSSEECRIENLGNLRANSSVLTAVQQCFKEPHRTVISSVTVDQKFNPCGMNVHIHLNLFLTDCKIIVLIGVADEHLILISIYF